MLAPDDPLYSHAEYFAREAEADVKSEYYQGRLVAMTGGSLNHNRIAKNISFAIDDLAADHGCETFIGDVRVWIEAKDIFAYPDVIVVCGQPALMADRPDTVTNPKIIIEVLSKSTAGYDKGDKFYGYWSLETFEEYVLVDQYQMRVEYFRRVDEKIWELRLFTRPEDQVQLQSVDATLPLDRIYRNVDWREPE